MNRDQHLGFLKGLDQKQNTVEYMLLGHIKVNAVYWALTALCVLGHGPWTDSFEGWSPMTRQEIIEFVESCKQPNGRQALRTLC